MSEGREPEADEVSPRGPGTPGSTHQERPPGPPGSRVFGLDRPAPGLYSLAWLTGVAGVGLLVVFVALASGSASGTPGPIGGVLLGATGLAFVLSFAAGSAYQVVARSHRPPELYRGPSPLILFPLVLFGVSLVVGLLTAVGLLGPASDSTATLVVELITTAAYLAAIWLFVVKTGALGWPGMGWPTMSDVARRLPGDISAGVALILPTYLVTIVIGGLLASVLSVGLPTVLPPPRTTFDAVATVLTGVVIAPIGEESFFRGLSLTAWWRDLGLRPALLRATLFFAVVHVLNVTASSAGEGIRIALLQFVVILPVGYVLGWLFSQRGIMASIAGHMTFNAIAVLLLFLLPGS